MEGAWHVFLISQYIPEDLEFLIEIFENTAMNNTNDSTTEESKHLRKLIDIPESILDDLKKLASQSDTNLKTYIQDILVETVNNYRNSSEDSK